MEGASKSPVRRKPQTPPSSENGAGKASPIFEKIAYIAGLAIMTFVIARVPVMATDFLPAISFTVCMIAGSRRNLYLIIPALAGILPYMTRGYDVWGYVAAIAACGLITAATRNVSFTQWQRGLYTAAVTVLCESIYHIATITTYTMPPRHLIIQGIILLIFTTVMQEKNPHRLLLMSILITFGCNLQPILWPQIALSALLALIYLDRLWCFVFIIEGGIIAALLEQERWGMMATFLIAAFAAVMAKDILKLMPDYIIPIIFVAVSCALMQVKSGVVLGASPVITAPAALICLILNAVRKDAVKRCLRYLSGAESAAAESSRTSAQLNALRDAIKNKIAIMKEMASFYDTYMDSRSVLSNQFGIMGQILERSLDPHKSSASKNDAHNLATSGISKVKIGVSQRAAMGNINGDCCGWQEISSSQTAVVLSDGMGKGKKAAAESMLVVKTAMGLLEAGADAEHIIRLINSIMLMKDDDSFATVDMLILDKASGGGRFYKTGAAPTLIKRKGRVEEIILSAVPLGIVNGLKISYLETELQQMDLIVMMSDGVADGGEPDFIKKLMYTLSQITSTDPQVISDIILAEASKSYAGKERDDMTVIVAALN